jgi:hypothetical protein
MSILNVGPNVQISGLSGGGQFPKITGVLGAPGIIPTGAVIYTAANFNFSGTPRGSIPPGYLPCDGGAYTKTGYPELWDAIRDTFNSTTGIVNPATGAQIANPLATEFRVPMLQGMFIRSWDGPVYNTSTNDPTVGGRIFASYQADDFKSHTHAISLSGDGQDAGGAVHVYNLASPAKGYSFAEAPNWINNKGGTETRPKNIALYAIIKY